MTTIDQSAAAKVTTLESEERDGAAEKLEEKATLPGERLRNPESVVMPDGGELSVSTPAVPCRNVLIHLSLRILQGTFWRNLPHQGQ